MPVLCCHVQSLVIPFAGVHILFGVFFAYWINGEPVTAPDYIGTALIFVGVMMVIGFGNKTAVDYDLDALISLTYRPAFLIYLGFDVAFTSGKHAIA